MDINTNYNEEFIIKLFLDGNIEAYSCIYKKYIQELFSYGKAFVNGDDDLLKDAIQDVFYKILKKPYILKDVHNIRFFLFKSLRNRIIDLNKKTERIIGFDGNFSEQLEFTIENITILDNIIESEERDRLSKRIKHLLEKLTARQREAVCLRYIYGMEYEEIAKILNMDNTKSAANLVSKAITALRKEEFYIFIIVAARILV